MVAAPAVVAALLLASALVAPTPSVAAPDHAPPQLTVDHVGPTVTRAQLAAGLRVRVGVDEPAIGAAELLIEHHELSIPRLPATVVASRALGLRPGAQTVRLRAAHGLPDGGRVRALLRVVAADAAGNLAGRTVALTIRDA